jgi:hypothetical protein
VVVVRSIDAPEVVTCLLLDELRAEDRRSPHPVDSTDTSPMSKIVAIEIASVLAEHCRRPVCLWRYFIAPTRGSAPGGRDPDDSASDSLEIYRQGEGASLRCRGAGHRKFTATSGAEPTGSPLCPGGRPASSAALLGGGHLPPCCGERRS